MTPIDRFERQLPAALTDLADPRSPDYVVDILGLTARTRQRPAWASIERWLPMGPSTIRASGGTSARRLTLIAIVAALAIIAVAALMMSGGRPAQLPAVAPGPSSAPTAAAIASGVAPSDPEAYGSPRPLPAALIGGWIGANRTTGGLLPGPVATVVFGSLRDTAADGPGYYLDYDGPWLQPSDVHEVAPGVIEIRSTFTNGDCIVRDQGRYSWSVTDDGQWLTLVPEGTDGCSARGGLLPGTWQRSLAYDSIGGPGVAANFLPYVRFTLPRETWLGGGRGTDSIVADSQEGAKTFKIWKDLDGFADPCDIAKGRANLKPGMDAFVRYLSTDPRFKVTSTQDLTVDGHRAVAVTFRIGDDIKAPCWTLDGNKDDHTGVLTWVQRSWDSGDFWNAPIASDDLLVVTEVDGTAIVFEAVDAAGGKLTLLRDVLDTVKFVNELPTPSAS